MRSEQAVGLRKISQAPLGPISIRATIQDLLTQCSPAEFDLAKCAVQQCALPGGVTYREEGPVH